MTDFIAGLSVISLIFFLWGWWGITFLIIFYTVGRFVSRKETITTIVKEDK